MNTKYIWLLLILLGFVACNDPEDFEKFLDNQPDETVAPVLTSGSADFSKYVAVGASFTAGFTDNALFAQAQLNSFPNTIAKQFAKIGGGDFKQPMMNGNYGGLTYGANRVTDPRLVFGGAGPVPLESVIGPVTVATDLLSNPTGPFNNLGVPGAKSFHLTAAGYGNLNNFPGGANPYATRLTGSTPDASILDLAMAQNPTFFTLSEVGGNDVLGYAVSGGDGTNPITPIAIFDDALNELVDGLTANGAKGAIGNIPYITSLAHFTTVPFNPLDPTNPDFGPQIPTLNATFAPLNNAFDYLGVPERKISFAVDAASPILIHDESLEDIFVDLQSALILGGLDPATATVFANQFRQCRQATAEDLIVLPASSVIATVNEMHFQALVDLGVPPQTAGQLSVNGITYPMEDKWVLLPSEQAEITAATDAYNLSIRAVANEKGLAFVDLKSKLVEAATNGIAFDEFSNMNTSLVFGGLVSLDGIHLTARGYALMANIFLQAIDETYGSNFEEAGALAKAADFPTNYSVNLP
ncbi:G-D-S-L family lipolytic protein [Flavobacteriaceae bacterium F08102]|nr:G-D-S-L family lipolytic protein [Flavobacteriaceae bacterium F08102]